MLISLQAVAFRQIFLALRIVSDKQDLNYCSIILPDKCTSFFTQTILYDGRQWSAHHPAEQKQGHMLCFKLI
jgi:hypothetical protein